MIPNKIKLIERFIEHYLKRFEDPEASQMLLSLVTKGVINPLRLRNYMIIKDYYQNLEKYDGISKYSLHDLAERYQLSERQIQNIVYKWTVKFSMKSNVLMPIKMPIALIPKAS